ncbi:MAG: MurR/RpiR family transcriptional regulator [Ruminococcaceae bacterium]|nr:MurR/RpiR family transcriptional regulator [Oscillospiraceae bacterium]
MEVPYASILDQIRDSYLHLTTAEQRIADYVLAQYEQVQFMSITQLADECNTADATVSRFCRRLNLKGFNAFKIELAKQTVQQPVDTMDDHPLDTQTGRTHRVARLGRDAIQQTIDLLRPEQVLQAVTILEKAAHVMTIGAGGSMIMASECAHLFSTVSGKFYAVADSHLQMSAVATMSKQDAIMLFSYSGATTNGLEALELAKSRGIPTLLVTRFPKSPAARLADVVLRCGSSEGPFQFGSVPARIAQLTVIDILFQEYCHRNQESCAENIRLIASALAGKHV